MKLKVCCIKSPEEAQMAIAHGADALGLVGPMPSGPGPISPQQAGIIAQYLPENTMSFYLTSKTSFETISEEYETVRSTHIQLTDHTESIDRARLKESYPKVKLVQVVHVIDEDSIQQAIDYQENSDYLLLDSGAPNNSVKELGGTGRIHNWDISKQIVDQCELPVFLAGGINDGNVRDAIAHVNPYGIDLCSSLRTNDNLDADKLDSFIKAIRS